MRRNRHVLRLWGGMCIVLLIFLTIVLLVRYPLQAQDEQQRINLAPRDEAEGERIQAPSITMTNGQNASFLAIIPAGIGSIYSPNPGIYLWSIGASDGLSQGEVTIQWVDSQGFPGQQQFGYQVNNIAPSATVSASTTDVLIGESVTVSFSDEFDPSPEDRAAGFTYIVDCDGDGTTHSGIATTSSTFSSCSYDARGTYTVHATIRDKDGGSTTYDELIITVNEAPSCTDPNPERDLTGVILNGGTHGEITNLSATCAYVVGMASYRRFNPIIDDQIIFDHTTTTIPPAQTLGLDVTLPQCSAQVDIFYGEVLLSLNGVRYGERLLAGLNTALPFCDPSDTATASMDSTTETTSSLPPAWQPDCEIADGRINDNASQDCSPPVVIYCERGDIIIWRVDPLTSTGSYWLTVDSAVIESVGIPESINATLLEQDNLGVYRLTTGEFQVNLWTVDAFAPDNTDLYTVIWNGC